MRRLLLSLIALGVFCMPSHVSAAGESAPLDQLKWRNVGPQVSGGRLGAVAGTDANPALYYAGAAGGGVWKSTNAGQSWEPVFDKQDVSAIGALAIDPQDQNVVWAGTGEGNPRNDVSQGDGVYKTVDGAKTWQRVLPLRDCLITKIIVDPRNSNTVLVAVLGDAFADNPDRGVYRTTDGGKTWNKTLYLGPASGASDLASSAKTPDVVYAGMWQFRRTAWSLQSGGPRDGVYKSVDGGVTWTKLTGNGLPAGEEGRIGLAVAPSNPNRVYALIQSKQGLLWRSDDGGATWQMINGSTLINERPFYYSHVFVDPTDQNHLWSVSVHLTVSNDGGKTFHNTGRGIHGDHHAMWNASNGKRIAEGNDGGAAFSHDGGATWQWDNVIPIAQLYHIAFDRRLPYDLCAPLQDNGVWCGPSDGLSSRGISSSQWRDMSGGDGTWAIPDAADPSYIWSASGGGNFAGEMDVVDTRNGESRTVSPYIRDQNVVDPKNLKYRFNWETPFAFDPFDPHRVYAGGNVLFTTTNRGYHWRVVSPDLTRNYRAHEVVTGGITLDGTGAETSETILYIEPSQAARGELWVGTDDGLVQLTRDGGKTWRNVTPAMLRAAPEAKRFGRFAGISSSPRDPGTAFAVYDLHMTGDRTPYLFVTHDYGAHWSDVASAFPRDEEVRSVRVDPRNSNLVYAGLENSFWASFDGGAHWRALNLNLPATSIRDIRVQPDSNDLLVATHGRAAWVLDDITPLQQLDRALAAGRYLFPVRTAYEWNEHSYWNTHVDGANPPSGAIVTFYLDKPAAHAPAAEVVDAGGRVVRHFTTHEESGRTVPDITNQTGLNRFTWDLAEDKPADWNFTSEWNKGYDGGAPVLPGTYTVRVHVGGHTLTQAIVVKQDPRSHYTIAQLRAHRDALRDLYGDFNRVDRALDQLSTIAYEAPLRDKSLTGAGNAALAGHVTEVAAHARALLLTLTEDPINDQDNDFLTDTLRERLQSTIDSLSSSYAPPTQAQIQEIHDIDALTADRMRAFKRFACEEVEPLNVQLRAANLSTITRLTRKPVLSPDVSVGGSERRHHGDDE
ncbi:MAG: WD40/YVTN/BNR-like repeat-containing protein [Vulcanimicrobiaceae bacterium]